MHFGGSSRERLEEIKNDHKVITIGMLKMMSVQLREMGMRRRGDIGHYKP